MALNYSRNEFIDLQQARVRALKNKNYVRFLDLTRNSIRIISSGKPSSKEGKLSLKKYKDRLVIHREMCEDLGTLSFLKRFSQFRDLKQYVKEDFSHFTPILEELFPSEGMSRRKFLSLASAGVAASVIPWVVWKKGFKLPENPNVLEVGSSKNVQNLEFKKEDRYHDELGYLAILIFGKARGCSYEEQLLVADVVLNRVNDSHFPNSVMEVIFQENKKKDLEFKSMSDANYKKLSTKAVGRESKAWESCVKSADLKLTNHYLQTRRAICTGFYFITTERYLELQKLNQKRGQWWKTVMQKYVSNATVGLQLNHLFSNMSSEEIVNARGQVSASEIRLNSDRASIIVRKNLHVCRENKLFPSTLIELGYISNANNVAFLMEKPHYAAAQVTRGIAEYFKSSSKNGTKIVVLDAGHGGHDSGAVGVYNENTCYEKDIVLKATKFVVTGLQQAGVTVFETRPDEAFVSLKGRTAFAKNVAQKNVGANMIFVSIHADSFTRKGACGPTGIYYNHSKGLDAEGKKLATVITEKMYELVQRVA